MSNDQHISQTDFIAFQNEFMNLKEKESFLEHICSCDFCSDQFATFMSEDIIPAPRDLKANIMKAVRRPEVQLAVKAKETSRQMQLFIYSLKVGSATIGALLLLILSMSSTKLPSPPDTEVDAPSKFTVDDDDKPSLTNSIWENMNSISNKILDFSNNIMKTEVIDNDQKEK